MNERASVRPRFLPVEGLTLSARELGQIGSNGQSETGELVPSTFDFLDFHNPVMRRRAQQMGFESGRVFLNLTTYEFLGTALKDGILERVREKNSAESFLKFYQLNWFFSFTDASSVDLAPYFGYTNKLGAAAFLRNYYRRIYRDTGEDVKSRFNLDDLQVKKQKRTQRYRDSLSRGRGGKMPGVRELVLQGITNRHEIAGRTGLTLSAAQHLIVKFRNEGIIPKTEYSRTLELKKRIVIAEDPQEFVNILRSASESFIKNSPLFGSVSEFLISHGYKNSRGNRRVLVNALIFNEEPLRKITFNNLQSDGSFRLVDGFYYLTKQEQRIGGIVNKSKLQLVR